MYQGNKEKFCSFIHSKAQKLQKKKHNFFLSSLKMKLQGSLRKRHSSYLIFPSAAIRYYLECPCLKWLKYTWTLFFWPSKKQLCLNTVISLMSFCVRVCPILYHTFECFPADFTLILFFTFHISKALNHKAVSRHIRIFDLILDNSSLLEKQWYIKSMFNNVKHCGNIWRYGEPEQGTGETNTHWQTGRGEVCLSESIVINPGDWIKSIWIFWR